MSYSFNTKSLNQNQERLPKDSPYYTNKVISTNRDDIKVTDADSFTLFSDSFRGSTRLYGVDAPETSIYEKSNARTYKERVQAEKSYKQSRKDMGKSLEKMYQLSQDYGAESTSIAKDFINNAVEIHVNLKDMDMGGRRLVDVYNQDGESLSTHLVAKGAAFAELPSDPHFDGSKESFERYELMIQAYESKLGIFAEDDFVLPSSFRSGNDKEYFKKRLDVEIKSREFKSRGIGNNQYAYVLADQDTYFTLPASLGASYFHGANLEHNLMEQNNYTNLAKSTHYKGLAEGIMEYNHYMLQGKELGTFERFAARAYDSGLEAGGVGNWLNREIFIPRGWGRVYKDEKGAIASVAGFAGKILDQSYMYYANLNPDWAMIGKDFKEGVGYGALEDNQQGIFQTVFENSASFLESMAQSLGMYLAITAPMEMATAGIAKNYMDQTIKGTMVDNTRLNALDPFDQHTRAGVFRSGRKPGFLQRFMAEFFLGDLGHQVQARPGGMTAAMLEERFRLDDFNEANPSQKKTFFDHRDGPKTGMQAMQVIKRGRARAVLEGTFKPFLIDLVNPFDGTLKADRILKDPLSPTGTRKGNAFDEFNLRVNRLIDIISAPIDLRIQIGSGQTVQFQSVTMELDNNADEVLTAAKEKVGKVTVRFGKNKTSLQTYAELKQQYKTYSAKIDDQMVKNNDELIRILQDSGLTETEARQYIFKGGKYKGTQPQFTRTRVKKEVERRMANKAEYVRGKNSLRSQLGSYASKLETLTTGTGMSYKTAIAAGVQDILDMMPLNPMKWGMVSRSAANASEFMTIGELFSFKHAAEFTEEVLTGENSISKVFIAFEPVVPDPVVDAKFLTKAEDMSNVARARMQQTDRVLGTTWDSIKRFFSGIPKRGVTVDTMTDKMRASERRIAKAAANKNKAAANAMYGPAQGVIDRIEAFRFSINNLGTDVAQHSAEVIVGDVGEETIGLVEDILDYTHYVRQGGKITVAEMATAMNRAGIKDVTSDVMNVTNEFSGNLKAEKFLKGGTGYIAGAVFISLALNNIMQSTGGVSIVSQLGLALYGEDDDIAIAFEGNRFLPTEAIAMATGIDQTVVNLAADGIAIGGTLALGHRIAKSIKTRGFMPYTFDEQTIYKMVEDSRFDFMVNEKGTMKVVDRDFIKAMGPGHDSFVTLVKRTGKLDSAGNEIIKRTVLTRTHAGFKSERVMQSFAQNVPTKTFIFGAIALLALEGTRKAAGTLLQAMAESPDDKNFGGMAAGIIGGSFLMGAGFNAMLKPLPTAVAGEAVAGAGGLVRSNMKLKMGLRGGVGWALGGAALASAIYVGKLVFDPNIEQKGSLDPIVAGAAFGLGVGVFKKSFALGGAAGVAALSVMAAVNWAGIRFLEVGRAGTEVDPHTAKLVAQLSQYSTAVLENEKDSVMFHTAMAAYASQFSAGKSILAEDPAAVAGEVQVIAKQSPLPFLQFFVAERIKGPRGSGLQNGGPDSERTVRSYSLGIQSGALFGTSISVELPVTYTPGQGFFGFTYNSENNLMAVPNFSMKVGVWAAAATSTVGIGFRFGAALSQAAYNMTGAKMFNQGRKNFTRHADDLFDAGKFMLGSAEKISTFFIRHTVGIFATLQGTDVQMAYETYKNSATNVQTAADKLADTSVTSRELSLIDAGADTFDDVSETQKAWKEMADGQLGRVAMRSKHMAVGIIVGSIAASMVHEIEKDRRLASSYEAGASYEAIARVEQEVEKRKMLYVVIGGSAGGILNDVRTGMGFIQGVGGGIKANSMMRSAYKRVLASKGVKATRIAARARLAVMKIRKSSIAKNFESKVLNNRVAKGIQKTASRLLSKKAGRYGIVFAAAMAFNYIKTNSEFGITTMMDRFVKYDDRGNAYNNYELQTAPARLHQLGVVAGMATYHTAIIGISAMPHLTQRETMLGAVQRKIDALDEVKDLNFFKRMKRTAGNLVMGIHYARSERETGALLQNLLTLDREAEMYDQFMDQKDAYDNAIAEAKKKGGKANGRPPTLDPKLQKIEDVLKLRRALGKEELMEYMALERKRRGLLKIDGELSAEELGKYKNFLGKMADNLDQADNLKHLGRGFRQTARFKTFARRGTAVIGVAMVLGGLIRTVGNQGGEIGKDSYLDRLYNKANEGSKLGQRGPDGKMGTLFEGARHITADMLRLITQRDIVDINYAVDSLNGKMVRTTGQRLVSNAKGVAEAQATVADLSEMVIFDNPNAYIATFDFGGRTLRSGDKGVTTSTYFQLQGPAQDISTATYSMAAKFIFNKYTAGKGRLATIIDRGMRDFDPNDPESFNKAGLAIRNATGMLHAMKTSRRYSRATAETAATFAGDSVVSAILAKRQEALAHQAWQPVDSLFTNMFFETIDKAKHRGQDNALLGFLEGIARNEQDVLQIFSNLMAGGVFENFFRRTAISNVKFFSGSFGKPPKKAGPQNMVADISALWHNTHDLSVQSEMFKQSRVEVFDNFIDKVASPMFNHSVLPWLPDWMKIGGVAVVGLGLTAVMTMSIAQYTHAKTVNENTGEMLEFFGRKDSVGATALDVAPEDINEIKKQLRKNVQDGGKMKWEADTRASTDNVLVMKGEAVDAASDLQARNQLIMNVSQAGKKERIRFQLSTYTNNFTEAEWDEFISFVNKKGDDIRNLFSYVDDATNSRMNIAHALYDDDQVRKWLTKIGVDPETESIYDIFRAASNNIVKKNDFIVATIEDFQSKFNQGLDKMYNLTDELDVNGSLFQEMTVTIDGKQKTFYAGELLDPDVKIDILESEYGALGQDSQGPSQRKQNLQEKYRKSRQKFRNQVENIVRDEMDKIEFDPNNMSSADQVNAVKEARRKALNRIKAEVADSGTEMGQVARGLGIVNPHDLPSERAAKEAATRGVQPTISNQGVSFLDEALDESLHFQRPKGTITFWDSLGVSGKGMMTAGFTVFDILQGGDLIGAYLRMAEALDSPYASDLDVKMAEKELGRAVLTSALGLAFGAMLGKLTKLGNVEWINKAIKNPKVWRNGIASAGAIGLITGMAYKSVIGPGLKKFSKYTEDKKVLRKVKGAWDNLWFTAADATGHLFAMPVKAGYSIDKALGGTGKVGAYGAAGFMGGALATAVIGIGLAGVMTISAIPLALTALGVGLVFGVGAAILGQKATSGMNYMTREVMKIPFLGQMSGMTDPYRQIRSQKRFQHHFVNSPFLLGYIGDIVNNNWLTTLAAAEDHTGRDQVANIYGEILAEGEGYGESHSAWKRQAADGLIGRPKPIVDEVINQELRIRAEFYSDNVIGRYTWDQLVKNSDNSGAIRAMDARNRAERIRIQEQARVRVMKAAMEAGGPREAMTTGSARKAAVVGLAAARVEQVYKDLDTDTASIKVTAASVTTHKSSVKNSDQTQAEQAKILTIASGPGMIPPLTLATVYTARLYVDSNTAVVDYESEPSDMNPILQQEAQVMTGGKAKTPEQQAQADTYNSHRDES